MNPFEIDPNSARAKTLATDFYTNPEFFEKSKEKIFVKSWQFLDPNSGGMKPGEIKPINLLPGLFNEPLILSCDNDNTLHCLSNVCTHRGALLIDKPCSRKDIRCPYHGRRFHLNGKFISMPEFKEVENFPAESDNLIKLPIYTIGPLLFTSLTNSILPEHFFAEMLGRIDWMHLEKLVYAPSFSKEYVVNAHWALYCENYLEGFHIPFVHASLNQVIDYGNYSTELFRYANLQVGIIKEDQLAFDIPKSSVDYGKKIGGYYFWVFPNLMFNFYPWGLSLNTVNPISQHQTKISFHTFIWDESTFNKGAGSDLNRVEMEDEKVVESVQKGIQSRYYSRGRYSVKQEKGTHHFHRLLQEFMQE